MAAAPIPSHACWFCSFNNTSRCEECESCGGPTIPTLDHESRSIQFHTFFYGSHADPTRNSAPLQRPAAANTLTLVPQRGFAICVGDGVNRALFIRYHAGTAKGINGKDVMRMGYRVGTGGTVVCKSNLADDDIHKWINNYDKIMFDHCVAIVR
ncbi:hypothetical protein GLAREA_03493 [Glarea lozoyensis ATCC 20868]|uniref:RanBP2-type domain-containing protein n=1 Tax=Glarea lozoyensis (strain ATCC 20868 / MF5171) TaxID=1116229 RepID=S3DEW0_GLAL2|nr:uncharacterized protein GLAREA_03493 [Glarea lozoyensis ATCC 20868]EPE30526.1 hypothetical protein GLAREA_03493 [Glarea lozoyensis ATCC 20868]